MCSVMQWLHICAGVLVFGILVYIYVTQEMGDKNQKTN